MVVDVVVVVVVVVGIVVEVVNPAVVVVAEEAPKVLVDNDFNQKYKTKRNAIVITQLEFVKPI